ncbi:MAG: phenylalanine--tRNA ligase beta subunit-related protein [Candidatus Shapirobacteria bacterium]|nr:phenylalanine--tRNA ligase beta subunit-related protein [Candidatus Shapirobacteria bacterium]
MKLIYSQLQKLLPSLNVEPQKLRDDLTMIGHFTNFFEEIEGEIVFDLDIKVNRGDCLGYYGLAKDLSVYYNIPLKKIESPLFQGEGGAKHLGVLPIQVSTDKVKRVMAIKISEINNTESPDWLKKFIKCHGNNPINTIVDLTNYIMFLYGIPNHAFDTAKSTDNLIWQINPSYKEFISLDGTKLELNSNILMINNLKKPLSLSFWGGEACAIDINTKEIIIEMAVYDQATIRQNSRQLKSVTEAATRLEKLLDSELIPTAFSHLIDLILKNVGGQISSEVFDYYPQKVSLPQIKFNYNKPSQVSGIEISKDFCVSCLTRLDCQIQDDLITPPSIRPDINIEADLVEEVVRFYGYQNIPTNEPVTSKDVPDITPKEIYLIDQLKDKLVDLGYDEILTWPLVSSSVDSDTVITTQNSINTESIYLRQSLIPALKQQLDQYQRLKLNATQFFEIGKIFFQINNEYIEKNSLGIYNSDINALRQDALQCVSNSNLENMVFDGNFVEIILDNLSKPNIYTPKTTDYNAYELTSQIITLDANVVFDKMQDSEKLIKDYSQKIGKNNLWQLVISDIFSDPKTSKFRYTFKASYFNLDDKTAKEIHASVFELK